MWWYQSIKKVSLIVYARLLRKHI
jgi:hypothetical protein